MGTHCSLRMDRFRPGDTCPCFVCSTYVSPPNPSPSIYVTIRSTSTRQGQIPLVTPRSPPAKGTRTAQLHRPTQRQRRVTPKIRQFPVVSAFRKDDVLQCTSRFWGPPSIPFCFLDLAVSIQCRTKRVGVWTRRVRRDTASRGRQRTGARSVPPSCYMPHLQTRLHPPSLPYD